MNGEVSLSVSPSGTRHAYPFRSFAVVSTFGNVQMKIEDGGVWMAVVVGRTFDFGSVDVRTLYFIGASGIVSVLFCDGVLADSGGGGGSTDVIAALAAAPAAARTAIGATATGSALITASNQAAALQALNAARSFARALGESAVTLGTSFTTEARGDNSVAIGYNALAGGLRSIAICPNGSYGAFTAGTNSFVLGGPNVATGVDKEPFAGSGVSDFAMGACSATGTSVTAAWAVVSYAPSGGNTEIQVASLYERETDPRNTFFAGDIIGLVDGTTGQKTSCTIVSTTSSSLVVSGALVANIHVGKVVFNCASSAGEAVWSSWGMSSREGGSVSWAGAVQEKRNTIQIVTEDATAAKMLVNGTDDTHAARVNFGPGFCAGVNINVIGKKCGETSASTCGYWSFRCIVSMSNDGTLALAGSVQAIGTPIGSNSGSPPAGWAVAITANNTTKSLDITVTGQAATQIQWFATVTRTEVYSF